MERIKLTNEVVKAITMCCPIENNDTSECFAKCALARACLEYWTGDNRMNKGENFHE
jgi:hypothetical protein